MKFGTANICTRISSFETPLHFPREATQYSKKIKCTKSRPTTPTQLQRSLISFLGIKLASWFTRIEPVAEQQDHSIAGANRLDSLCFLSEYERGVIFSGYFTLQLLIGLIDVDHCDHLALVNKMVTSLYWFLNLFISTL